MRYWWVNHKQTSRHEIAGGFLWSPMRKANGARNHFYDTMRDASPGDVVISYSHGKISYAGIVTEFAIPTPKPPVFGTAGSNWDKINGWLLPVAWKRLDVPVIPKHYLDQLRPLLPLKYSPISPSTGDGNQSCYLTEVGKHVFDHLVPAFDTHIGIDDDSEARCAKILQEIDGAIEQEERTDPSIESTIRPRLVNTRVGQNVFKERIYEFEKSCRLTRVATADLLIASHIKPWRLCESAAERLDGANGLLLTPHVDYLFDRGLISFTDEGGVLVSGRAIWADLKLLGLEHACAVAGQRFHTRQTPYLEFHRNNIFLS